MQKLLSLSLFLSLSSASIKAQSIEQLQQLYPDRMAVFSNIETTLDIKFQDGVPSASSTEIQDMAILGENGNGMFSKDKVYHSQFHEMKKLEAYSLVPDGSSTKKIKVTNFKTQASTGNGVFYDDVKETSFDYPMLMKGSIAHVQTDYYYKDIRMLNTFYFSNFLPVYKAKYTVTYPDNIDIRYIIKNDAAKKIFVKESKRGKRKTLEFSATDVDSYNYFGNGTSLAYYAAHVIVYVAGYNYEGTSVPVFSSVDELYKWNAGFIRNVNTKQEEAIQKLGDSICLNKKEPAEKARAIYQWVQEHIKYVAFEEGLEGFVPRQAVDVCNKRYGDCKDMASLLVALLKQSGLQAYFTWIGTRSIPYTYSEVPLPITDNHMICALRMDDRWVFLDATDPNCIFGMPTSGIQGKQALIGISDEKFELVTVPVMKPEESIITDSTFLSIKDNKLVGNCSVNYLGYFGADVYNSLLYNKGDDERVYARRRMGKGSNKFIMKDYKISLPDPATKTANISSEFEIPDYVKSISGEIYINLNLEKLFNSSPIDTVKRKAPIENDYLHTINQIHDLSIPDGYELEYVPKDFSVSNNLIDFSIEYKKTKNKITATQKLVSKKLYIQPDEFADWNKAVLQISPAYKEQVVLKKKM